MGSYGLVSVVQGRAYDVLDTGRNMSPNRTPEQNLARAVLAKAIEDCDPETQRFKFTNKYDYCGKFDEALEFILDGRAKFWCEVSGFDYSVLLKWAKDKKKELIDKGAYDGYERIE